MLPRIISRLLVVFSIAGLAGVVYFFIDEFRSLRYREQIVKQTIDIAQKNGPCEALASLRKLGSDDAGVQDTINGLRRRLVTDVTGEEDPKARNALVSAEREGIVDSALCEQLRLSHQVGEVHPVLSFLRYTREGSSPCDEETRLSEVLDGLGSHRPIMLRALMRDVQQLGCLSSELKEKIAIMVANIATETPLVFDGLDEPRIATFLNESAPLAAAQLGCKAQARGGASKLAKAIGCSDSARRDVLVHYLVAKDKKQQASTANDVDEVVLLYQTGPFCEVMAASGGALRTVACRNLTLASDLVIAVAMEKLSYGHAQADLIAGVVNYNGKNATIEFKVPEPEIQSWSAYNIDGESLGTARRVDLAALAALRGESMPDDPLRSYCKKTGAKYCYDVDWAHVVSRTHGVPVIFLSRPTSVFLKTADLTSREAENNFRQIFGRVPQKDSYWRIYILADGSQLLIEASETNVAARWRVNKTAPWQKQDIGHAEGGTNPPTANLLAVLDIQQNGIPSLVLRRSAHEKTEKNDNEQNQNEELLLMQLDQGQNKFVIKNHLTIHEY
ncbi:MAG: hypothetical protein JW841_02850 [Deltaproteobacteria bacterium]|nr:hypothetical protein [Deltaproteobacteria bacterium]